MDYQQAYKIAEEINTFFGLGFDGHKLAQLSQILINNAAQQNAHPTVLQHTETAATCPHCHNQIVIGLPSTAQRVA